MGSEMCIRDRVDTHQPGHEPSDLEKFFETITAAPPKLTRFTPADIVEVIREDREDH